MDAAHHPDHPPKRPVEPPRPAPGKPVEVRGRLRMSLTNRRAANWGLESAPWAPSKARGHVIDQLHSWGFREADDTAGNVAELLVSRAVNDGGRRVSLHLADQDRQALIVVLSHRAGLAVTDERLLPAVAALGATSCGAETAQDSRRLWAVLDL
ncbi:hypothetical protein ACFRK5_08745 [Streptomyces niveus]|uniref:hypothetical protein n=1 Tax=Streptomyces niveus TaxID=193462 RepID=UPI0036741CDF